MNLDERLDKLTARHEALAESLELMKLLHEDEFRRMAEAHRQNEEAHLKNEEAQHRNQEAMATTQVMIVQVVESVKTLVQVTNSLVDVAHLHERRISNLEGH